MNNQIIGNDDLVIQMDQKNIQRKTKFDEYQEQVYQSLGISQAGHPLFCFLHMLLKGFTIFFYLFMGWIFSTILIFMFVILLNIVDFWIVKNITG